MGLGLACALLSGAFPALATTARIAALGGRSDFFTDDANTYRWSSIVADYPDLVIIDTGRFDLSSGYHDTWGTTRSGPGVGLHAALDPKHRWGTLGIFLHGQESAVDPGSLHNSNLTGIISGIYAHRLGSLTAALHFRHARDTRGFPAHLGLDSQSVTTTRNDLGAGVRWSPGHNILLDLDGEVRGVNQDFPAQTSAYPEGDFDSWDSFNLRTRAFIGINDRLALVALAEHISDNVTLITSGDEGLAPFPVDRTLVHLGMGLNFFPDPDNMLVLSSEFLTATDNAGYDEPFANPAGQLIDHALVLRLAFETRLNPWLTARASAGLETISSGNIDTDHIPLAMGLSAYAARIALDLAVSDRLPRTISRLALSEEVDESATWLTVNLRYAFRD